jgi:chromosomal replication initiation ATPase DnaA
MLKGRRAILLLRVVIWGAHAVNRTEVEKKVEKARMDQQSTTLAERRRHPARGLAIVLRRRHTSLNLREIGERCGGSDYAAVSQAKHRTEAKLRDDKRLAARAERIAKRIMSEVEM